MSLAKSNKHLNTAQQRDAAIQRNARASSIFEGASARSLKTTSEADAGKKEYNSVDRSTPS